MIKNNKKIIILTIIILLIVIFLILDYISCNTIKESYYTIESSKIPKEFSNYKIVQLSDLHNKYYGENGERLVDKIKKINPNLIVITGDMVNTGDTDYSNFFNIAKELSKNYTIYYILGNHEEDLSKENINKIVSNLEEYNINILIDESDTITIGKEHINIYGLSKQLKTKSGIIQNRETLDNLLNNINKDEFNILLAHNPLIFEEYAKYNVDLIFSGHVHGGAIRLPVLGGILSPNITFFPKYDKGHYVINNSNLIVSAGIGIGRFPIRIFNYLDIPIITLKSI